MIRIEAIERIDRENAMQCMLTIGYKRIPMLIGIDDYNKLLSEGLFRKSGTTNVISTTGFYSKTEK